MKMAIKLNYEAPIPGPLFLKEKKNEKANEFKF